MKSILQFLFFATTWMVGTSFVFAETIEINVDGLQCERKRVRPSCQDDGDTKSVLTKRTKEGKCYYVNAQDQAYNSNRYDWCGSRLREGVTSVCVRTNGEKKCGLAKLSGEFVVPPIYEEIGIPHEGRISVKKADKWGIIDINQNPITPIKYRFVSNFHEGIAQVREPAGLYSQSKISLIDRGGKVAFSLPEGVGRILYFQDGLMAFSVKRKWGYLNKKGEVVIAPQYALAKPFSGGYAPVRLVGSNQYKWALINKSNEKVHVYTGDIKHISGFSNGASLITFACDNRKDEYGNIRCSEGCVDISGQLRRPVCGTVSFR